MRPPRLAILALFAFASAFLFCRAIVSFRRSIPTVPASSASAATLPLPPHAQSGKTVAWAFFAFSTPFSLFPPNAAISLTDDNSTFFPARPAAFGPPLPTKGLSGQLWIGSGFGDDSLQEGSEGEGELGCSDVPGWDSWSERALLRTVVANHKDLRVTSDKPGKNSLASDMQGSPKRDGPPGKALVVDRKVEAPSAKEPQKKEKTSANLDDGTDDYLHQELGPAGGARPHDGKAKSHADIQSIQETAEITGKIVLLSRGGCGFLEKVEWAQRRGATALIVGDNQKGGPLIQMFARGNVDNVTIPSVFTSRTTAHLLSSLMQPGSYIEDILGDSKNSARLQQESDKAGKTKSKPVGSGNSGSSGSSGSISSLGSTSKSAAQGGYSTSSNPVETTGGLKKGQDSSGPKRRDTDMSRTKRKSWVSRLFHWGSSDASDSDRSRPPSSGRFDWVMVDDWNDEKDKQLKKSLEKESKGSTSADDDASDESYSAARSGDNFQIGVQDWRDPDLLAPLEESGKSSAAKPRKIAEGYAQTSSSFSSTKGGGKKKPSTSSQDENGPKGGSITPGSGEYIPEPMGEDKSSKSTTASGRPKGGLFSKLFSAANGGSESDTDEIPATPILLPSPVVRPPFDEPRDEPEQHEGLWVTITPTSGASPFFDTLLVLVISPLVTLTVVYTLLIVRAKIRRRRWRAPKSVVERLPVRTYHTVVSPSPGHSPRLPSPTTSSPTTPLLQGGSGSSSSRPRPRSRTTTGVPEPADLLRVDSALHQAAASGPRSPSHDRGLSSEWKKYMGRQVECVVCLEEYIDGVSRVMSLPCGHEFHVECITPWLTTRRRTCPICKGDVVRSLARRSPTSSSPRYEPYRDDSDDDIEAGSGGFTGASSSSQSQLASLGLQEPSDGPEGSRGRRTTSSAEASWFTTLMNSLNNRLAQRSARSRSNRWEGSREGGRGRP